MAAQDFEALAEWVGAKSAMTVATLCGRVKSSIEREWAEDRPLFLAGALLTRLQPPPMDGNGHHNGEVEGEDASMYDYSVAHIDKANVASYDYSAVLYLNSKHHSFEGGDFCFLDEDGDSLLEPKQGRCVIFPSGAEHLHQVQNVTQGSRFVLASWYTLSGGHGLPIPSRASVLAGSSAVGSTFFSGTRHPLSSEGEENQTQQQLQSEEKVDEENDDGGEEMAGLQAMLDAQIATLQRELSEITIE